jgi:hypothetical protein
MNQQGLFSPIAIHFHIQSSVIIFHNIKIKYKYTYFTAPNIFQLWFKLEHKLVNQFENNSIIIKGTFYIKKLRDKCFLDICH